MFELGQDLHPELRALVGLKPQPEDLALAVDADRQREITGAALDGAAFADLEHERVEEHDGVDVLQRPGLPGADVVHDRVGDAADQVAADADAVDVGQVRLDIPRREAAAVEREDLLVKALKAALALSDDRRLKACRCDRAAR